MSSVVVYTAVFGDRDILKDPISVNSNFDYVCYTDNPDAHKCKKWNMIKIDRNNELDPNRAAKIYKILPHRYFPQYDISIWTDGNKLPKTDLLGYINTMKDKHIVLLSYMPSRGRTPGLHSECQYCIKRNLDDKNIIFKQWEDYAKDGYEEHDKSLYFCGMFCRKHNEQDVIDLNEDWWEQICKYSRRDQISFPYVVKKHKDRLKSTTIRQVETHKWFLYGHHNKDVGWAYYSKDKKF